MRGYSATHVFQAWELDLLRRAEHVVRQLPEGLRCHEVARVVQKVLGTGVVRDGKLSGTRGCKADHSWVVLEDDGMGRLHHVLDCYAVGQVPPVQLVDAGFPLDNPYVTGEDRGDINHALVDKLVAELKPCTRVYAFNNDRDYEESEDFFIEADPTRMEQLLSLMLRCWPRSCQGCGKARRDVAGPTCEKLPGSRKHEFRRAPFLICAMDDAQFSNGCGALSFADGLHSLAVGWSHGVCDLAALRELLELAAKIDPDHCVGEPGDFFEVPR